MKRQTWVQFGIVILCAGIALYLALALSGWFPHGAIPLPWNP